MLRSCANSRSECTVFLSVAQVERRHRLSIQRFGGADGVRDRGSFESAIFQPPQRYFYTQADLFEVAAAYAFAQAPACFDGNKRTGVAAALLFPEVKAFPPDFESMPLYDAIIAVAERRMTRSGCRLEAVM